MKIKNNDLKNRRKDLPTVCILIQENKKNICEFKQRNHAKIKTLYRCHPNNNRKFLVNIVIYSFLLIVSGLSFGFFWRFFFTVVISF